MVCGYFLFMLINKKISFSKNTFASLFVFSCCFFVVFIKLNVIKFIFS